MHFGETGDTEPDGPEGGGARRKPSRELSTRVRVGLAIAVVLVCYALSRAVPVVYLVLLR